MMWRFSIFISLLLCGTISAQTKPVPPPPPPVEWYTPPTQQQILESDFKRHEVMDELLNSTEYYLPKDLIFHESSTKRIAESKLRSARLVALVADTIIPDEFGEEVLYNEQGKIAQTTRSANGGYYSQIRRWKYNADAKVQTYVTLSVDIDRETRKRKISGDSMSIIYLANKSISEIRRYAVRNSGATRTATIVSIRKFTYNPDGTLKQRTEDGSSYYYFYDNEKRPIYVSSSPNKSLAMDSFAWRSDGTDLTVEHWILGYQHKYIALMEKQTTNIASGNLLEYALYPSGKFNYIRQLYGPITIKCKYDVQSRRIREGYYDDQGKLLNETSFEYFNDNAISKITVSAFWGLDENNSLENYPPAAQLAADHLYEVYEISYEAPKDGEMPSTGVLTRRLVSIQEDKREVLATGPSLFKLKVLCTYN